jgi:hypothetical protein
MSKNRPVHEVRLGFVKASIWENITNDVTRHSVTLQKIYKDGDQWKSTESFSRDDLLPLAKVIDRAHSWIHDKPTTAS